VLAGLGKSGCRFRILKGWEPGRGVAGSSFPSGKETPDKGYEKQKDKVKVEADLAGRSSDYSVGGRGRAGRDRSKGEWWRRVGVAVFILE
jgi:hypothetical protein